MGKEWGTEFRVMLRTKRTWASGSYKSVYVPDEEHVEIKECTSVLIHDFKKELKRVKQGNLRICIASWLSI